MTDIILTQESGTWSEWDNPSTTTSIAITTAAALGGTTYGIEVSNTASGSNPDISTYTVPPDEFRVAFRFDPNTASLLYASTVWSVDDGLGNRGAYLTLNTDGTLTLSAVDDTGSFHDAVTTAIPSGESTIECIIKRATTSTSADGYATIVVNSNLESSVYSIDNYDSFAGTPNRYDDFLIHDFSGTGSYYIDEITIRVNDSTPVFPPLGQKTLSLATPLIGGGTVWRTYWDGSNLQVDKMLASTGAVQNTTDLGTCSSAELELTYAAYVFPINDSVALVYGYFVHPTLGAAQIISTTDGGTSWSVVQSGWGTDQCGSLVATASQYIYAVRNETTNAVLYAGSIGGLVMFTRGELPFPSVTHGNLIMDTDGNLFALSSTASTTMVVVSPPPYTRWFDITSDHPPVVGNRIIRL